MPEVTAMKQKSLYVFLCVVVAVAVSGYGVFRWFYPYGLKPCYASCMGVALAMYATQNAGWFPYGSGTSLRDLQRLYPKYISAGYLAGLTGDANRTRAVVTGGGVLDE